MLKYAEYDDIDNKLDSVWEIAQDRSRSSYPRPRSKEELKDSARKSLRGNFSRLLLYYEGGRFAGWIGIYAKGGYLQLMGCHIGGDTGKALSELLDFIDREYPAHQLHFGFPGENRAAEGLLSRGFSVAERLDEHEKCLFSLPALPVDERVVRVDKDNFPDFAALHTDSDMYWTSEKIAEHIDDWQLFVYRSDSEPLAAICSHVGERVVEPFGVDFAGEYDEAIFKSLVTAALNAARETDAERFVFFTGAGQRDAMASLGFDFLGEYVLYERNS